MYDYGTSLINRVTTGHWTLFFLSLEHRTVLRELFVYLRSLKVLTSLIKMLYLFSFVYDED